MTTRRPRVRSLRAISENGASRPLDGVKGLRTARPCVCARKRSALDGGRHSDLAATDQAVLDTFGENEHLCRWIRLAGQRVAFQGLPAPICWLGYGERPKMGLAFNDLVTKGKLSAPIVIGRHHLDCGFDAIRAGRVILADGTKAAAASLARRMISGPASGMFSRCAGIGAGYERAQQTARDRNVIIPR